MPATEAALGQQARRRQRRELAWVVTAALASYALSAGFELHERLYRWLALYEHWQVDELPLALLVLASGLAVYAFRRRHEAQLALALHAQAEARTGALLADNRELAQGLLALQENERRALARELHDEMGQRCTALRMETALLRQSLDGDRSQLLGAAERADAAALSLYQLVRDLLRRLRPAQLDTLGLIAALQDLCEGWELRSGVPCVFHHEGVEPGGDDALAMAVYRVAQEALTNVMRHAQASTVRVLLLAPAAGGPLRLTVQDDGVGLPANRRSGGLGLLGAAERAAALGGELRLHGAPGAGTTLELWLPQTAVPQATSTATSTVTVTVTAASA